MLIVSIESPFKPSEEDVAKYAGRYSRADLLRQNIVYARLALRDSLLRGESPFASHLLYTQVWSEDDDLRDAGIKAGVERHHRSDLIVLYRDLGVSVGMRRSSDHAKLINVDQTSRTIIDVADGRDPREELAHRDVEMFPYLEQLEAAPKARVIDLRKENGARTR